MNEKNPVSFIVKKETVSSPGMSGRCSSYKLAQYGQESYSLEEVKEVAEFLKAYVEQEEKEEGGAR